MEQDKRQLLPFFLCTASVMLILTGMLGIFSLFPYLYTRSLTAAHAEEFKRFLESSGLPEGENAEIRVLRYRKNRARVSFLSADGKRESVCTFLREDRASGDGTPSHAKRLRLDPFLETHHPGIGRRLLFGDSALLFAHDRLLIPAVPKALSRTGSGLFSFPPLFPAPRKTGRGLLKSFSVGQGSGARRSGAFFQTGMKRRVKTQENDLSFLLTSPPRAWYNILTWIDVRMRIRSFIFPFHSERIRLQ